MPGVMSCIGIFRAGEAETGRSLGATGQPVQLIGELWANECYCLKGDGKHF